MTVHSSQILLILKIGTRTHSTHDSTCATLERKISRERTISTHLNARICCIEILDKRHSLLNREQTSLRDIISNSNDHSIEQAQRLIDHRSVSSSEWVKRPGKYNYTFSLHKRKDTKISFASDILYLFFAFSAIFQLDILRINNLTVRIGTDNLLTYGLNTIFYK